MSKFSHDEDNDNTTATAIPRVFSENKDIGTNFLFSHNDYKRLLIRNFKL